MGRLHAMTAAALLALAAGAGAQDAATPPREVAPGANQDGVVHVNAMKNPEVRAYRAVVAGLDAFDAQHALAPDVPQLRFQVEGRGGKPLEGDPLVVRIAADDFSIPLGLDEHARFSVPRSQAAWDAKAELVLNRRKHDARVETWVRTPGLPDNQARLGDIRLDCRVKVAIGKAELPFWAVGLVNGLLLTTDWCSWFKGAMPKGGDRNWSSKAPSILRAATLHDGDRSLALEVDGKSFRVPIGDTSWGNDAIIALEFASPEPAPGLIRTADETPRTAP